LPRVKEFAEIDGLISRSCNSSISPNQKQVEVMFDPNHLNGLMLFQALSMKPAEERDRSRKPRRSLWQKLFGAGDARKSASPQPAREDLPEMTIELPAESDIYSAPSSSWRRRRAGEPQNSGARSGVVM
jgi:hypothetical protein